MILPYPQPLHAHIRFQMKLFSSLASNITDIKNFQPPVMPNKSVLFIPNARK